jgi:hypothetical protein
MSTFQLIRRSIESQAAGTANPSFEDHIASIAQEEEHAWKTIKLPTAGPKEMEAINGRLCWTDALHCSPTISKRPTPLDMLAESEFFKSSWGHMDAEESKAFAEEEFGIDESSSGYDLGGFSTFAESSLTDSENIPTTFADPGAFMDMMHALHQTAAA